MERCASLLPSGRTADAPGATPGGGPRRSLAASGEPSVKAFAASLLVHQIELGKNSPQCSLVGISACSFDQARLFGQRRCFEQRAHGDLDPKNIAQPGHDLDCQQRVTSQVEEIVVGADELPVQQLRPDFADGLHHGIGQPAEPAVAESVSWRRQCVTVDLAVGSEGKSGQLDEGGRDHVVGQLPLEDRAQAGNVQSLSWCHYVSHQLRLARHVLAQLDKRFAYLRLLPQQRLDLPRLDAKAAKLDLDVDTTQELDLPSGR